MQSATTTPDTSTDAQWDIRDVEAFIYREARLADEHNYDEWEGLWADDAIYWVPIGHGNEEDPGSDISVIFDHRRRISTRLKQLRTGHRYAQTPQSKTRRVISNAEIRSIDGNEATVEANFVIVEHRPRATEFWSGRVTYGLRRTEGSLMMFRKKVNLINSDEVLPTLAFLI
ncbi:aromatic-ring-hydroxylating dioxygenase subunit beta [Rhodococcoides fascians]|uniref:aromatic-ring-hydroxylating dioxygenase subunit beta n=1 Tax=Rhodococcoides fascians TaxID=1828 RepID=UPI00050CB9CD|nr:MULTISPECIES: aromatic-ring-hydroxylating dioxygenase subunit beta [Rhodococcus]